MAFSVASARDIGILEQQNKSTHRFLLLPKPFPDRIWKEAVLRGCTISDFSGLFSSPFPSKIKSVATFLMEPFWWPHSNFPISLSAHILIMCITHLELTISCWTWSAISKLWLFPSQLLSKACSGENQLSSPSASPIGPSSVPWACARVPGLGTAGVSHRALIITRTYLLASPRGRPGQQTQREKKIKLNSLHFLPTVALKEDPMVPFDGGWAASWALWGDGKYHHDHTARQKKGREGEGVEVPTLILQMTFFFCQFS